MYRNSIPIQLETLKKLTRAKWQNHTFILPINRFPPKTKEKQLDPT